MEKRHKDILRILVAELRRTLAGTADGSRRGDLDRALERLGIATDGAITPFDALPSPTPVERHARQVAEAELAPVDAKERPAARAAFVERAAYGWVNRLLALRVLEARGLIDETLRGNPAYDGLSEALYVLRQSNPARASGPDGGWWAVIEDACATQATALPGLFALDSPRTAGSSSALHDPAIALRPGATALVRCVELLGAPPAGTPKGQEDAALAEMDAAFADPDAIGWAYQFYQDEVKAQVYARLQAGKKVTTRDDIAAATQLFTEPYMVQWLLQNSLGRSYHEAYPQSAIPATWAYYIQPERLDVPAFSTLESLTLLDPCVGSGHFVREAFDMFVAMYREQQPHLSATEIASRILEHHLYGIDIDPRAAQLAAFTLYARAWELVRDERRTQRRPGSGSYTPEAMNLAASPERIAPGALARHLQRHPEDRMLEPLLKGVFAALERADILGSLLRPREHLQAAIAELRKPHNLRLGTVEEQDLQAVIETVAHTDPGHLEEMLLDRVAASFAAEARDTGDVAAALFGRAAERGVRLLQILDRQYAVVATNPPYMDSGAMDKTLKQYIDQHYPLGRSDAYASFILRSHDLAIKGHGKVAMVTQRAFLNNSYCHALRRHLLHETTLELLCDLGSKAFSNLSGERVSVALHISNNRKPFQSKALFIDVRSLASPIAKIGSLKDKEGLEWQHEWSSFLKLPECRIMYGASRIVLNLFSQPTWESNGKCESFAFARRGLDTGDVVRWARYWWEVGSDAGWVPYIRGPQGHRWNGGFTHVHRWGNSGERVKATGHAIVASEAFYQLPCATFSRIGSSSLLARSNKSAIISDSGSGVFSSLYDPKFLCAILNSRIIAHLLRIINPSYNFQTGDINDLPRPANTASIMDTITKLADLVQIAVKRKLARDPIEASFTLVSSEENDIDNDLEVAILAEGIDRLSTSMYIKDDVDISDELDNSVGERVWSFPALQSHESLTLPQRLEYLDPFLRRIQYDHALDNRDIKQELVSLYSKGSSGQAGGNTESLNGDELQRDLAEVSARTKGGHTSADTLLEVLSAKLKIHPISTYWLLQEIRAEGARCKPEEQRLLEDRLSVIVLRLLGYRWPKQLEAGELVPNWVDRDGIIPLLAGTPETTLADRMRDRLRVEDGDLGVQQTEALLVELTDQNLETWLRRTFFPRHVRQFKYRPIAWHLSSTSVAVADAKGKRNKGKGGSRQVPAFECMVYYHACGLGLLARLRTQYVEPLLHAERGRVDSARQSGDDTAAAQATARVQELEAFVERVRGVEEQGFDMPDLQKMLCDEPLDRWSGDGILAPTSRDALLAQERAWVVDLNDGVRVNIAPVQLAGVLASDVLKGADAKKALDDRARWRADERRWVREGVLPRCGWMAEDIPASPRWTERAPEREGEQRKLEQKRAAAMARLAQDDGGSE